MTWRACDSGASAPALTRVVEGLVLWEDFQSQPDGPALAGWTKDPSMSEFIVEPYVQDGALHLVFDTRPQNYSYRQDVAAQEGWVYQIIQEWPEVGEGTAVTYFWGYRRPGVVEPYNAYGMWGIYDFLGGGWSNYVGIDQWDDEFYMWSEYEYPQGVPTPQHDRPYLFKYQFGETIRTWGWGGVYLEMENVLPYNPNVAMIETFSRVGGEPGQEDHFLVHGLAVYRSNQVKVTGVPEGGAVRLYGQRPIPGEGGILAVEDPVPAILGVAVFDAGGEHYPFSGIEVLDNLGAVVGSLEPEGGVWGGDEFEFAGGTQDANWSACLPPPGPALWHRCGGPKLTGYVSENEGAYSFGLPPSSAHAGGLYLSGGTAEFAGVLATGIVAATLEAGILNFEEPGMPVTNPDLPLRARLLDRGGAFYNVKAYGVLGDGSDETDKIQVVLDMAGVTGGTVYFPTGIYGVNPRSYLWLTGASNRGNYACLLIPSNVTVAGAGKGSEIKLLSTLPAPEVTDDQPKYHTTHMMANKGAVGLPRNIVDRNIRVTNLAFNGNDVYESGQAFTTCGVSEFSFDHNYVFGSYFESNYIVFSRGGQIVSNTFTKVGLYQVDGSGPFIDSSTNIIVAHNTISDCGYYAVLAIDCWECHIVGNTVRRDDYQNSTGYEGIRTSRCSNMLIEGNTISEAGFSGVTVHNGSHNRVVENYVFHCGYGSGGGASQHGIAETGSSTRTHMAGNRAVLNNGAGLAVVGVGDTGDPEPINGGSTVIGNECIFNGRDGIAVYGKRHRIIGNLCESNGLHIQTGVLGDGYSGIAMNGASYCIVMGNVCCDPLQVAPVKLNFDAHLPVQHRRLEAREVDHTTVRTQNWGYRELANPPFDCDYNTVVGNNFSNNLANPGDTPSAFGANFRAGQGLHDVIAANIGEPLGRLVMAEGFFQDAVPAAQAPTNIRRTTLGTAYQREVTVPFTASVRYVQVKLTSVLTAGSLTAEVYVNGAATGVIATINVGQSQAHAWFPRNFAFVDGLDELTLRISTMANFAPAGAGQHLRGQIGYEV